MLAKKSTSRLSLLFILAALMGFTHSASAATAPNLGAAGSFAVLAGSQVNNSGATVVTGDLGVSPGTTVTGFPPGLVTGTIQNSNEAALKAQVDATAAAISLGTQKADENLSGKDLGGMTLKSGVYLFTSSAQLTGKLVLDGANDSNSVFIFQVAGSFTTADNASIELANGAKSSNVFFVVGNTVTVGTGSSLVGTFIASSDVTLAKAVKLEGKSFSLAGSVTLDEDAVTNVLK